MAVSKLTLTDIVVFAAARIIDHLLLVGGANDDIVSRLSS